MKRKQTRFGLVEGLLVIVTLGLAGFVGWYIWQTQPQGTQQLETYKRTTTVPSNWKSYANNTYKFSMSYPANWKIDEGTGTLGEDSLASDKSFFSVGFRPYSTGAMEIQYALDVTHETLQQAIATRKSIVEQSANGAVKITITGETYFTYDGHKAVRFDMAAGDSYTSEIYISANNLLYKFDAQFHDKEALQDNDVLTLFESLKIQ